jgi:hypothetical protein
MLVTRIAPAKAIRFALSDRIDAPSASAERTICLQPGKDNFATMT